MTPASSSPAQQTDRDLASVAEARALARRAKQAWIELAELDQDRIDAIVDAMAAAATAQAEAFARLAVEETGYGVVEDKIQKNLFSSEKVYRFIRPMKTVGVVARDEDRRVVEIAEPFGVVAAVVPSTNPTSTAIYKILIAIKARCAIVLSPHPAAVRCITRVAEAMAEAAVRAGAPAGSIAWMTTVTIEGTQELMKHRDIAVILATGGMGLVRAAYSAGKPAYGVGPGNAPAYVERSANVKKAVHDVIAGKTFDNGVLCSSENSVVVDEAIGEDVRREFEAQGAYFMNKAEIEAVGRALVTPQRLPNPELVGKAATTIAAKCGLAVPPSTTVLVAPLDGVGRDYPLSIEKLCPVLSYYVVRDWREGCERCKQILRYGGMGHTMSIHSQNEQVILEFGLKKPAFRIVVNSPATHGSVGLSTGLDPAMTLGCGGYGGNITSDNISPRHLLNIKRLAYEVAPVVSRWDPPSLKLRRTTVASGEGGRPFETRRAIASSGGNQPGNTSAVDGSRAGSQSDFQRSYALPEAPRRAPAAGGIDAGALSRRIDEFLSSRGYQPQSDVGLVRDDASSHGPRVERARTEDFSQPPLDFVCEEDVRRAIRAGRKLPVSERAIVTPAARDLGEEHRIFLVAPWRG
jgi:acetaldehyde dehydrogenase (acetylating)